MTHPSSATDQPERRVDDRDRVLRALREAVRDALRRHKQAGQPIVVWQDGQVTWIQPEDIPVD